MEEAGGGGRVWFASQHVLPHPLCQVMWTSLGQVGPTSATGILRMSGIYRKGVQPFPMNLNLRECNAEAAQRQQSQETEEGKGPQH